MRNPFRKSSKKMTDRPEVSPDEEIRSDQPTGQDEQDGAQGHAASNMDGDNPDTDRLRAELDARKVEHDALYDKYVRLHAEFDNFRKRTAKERMDLLSMAGADAIKSVLPVMDDMERAIAHNAEVTDLDAMKQGFELIHQKFVNILLAQGIKPIVAKGEPFDAEYHDAVGRYPAPEPELKGKVIDVVETGYMIHDKVLRYAKVVVGE